MDSQHNISTVLMDGIFENSQLTNAKITFPNNSVRTNIHLDRSFKRCYNLKTCELIFRGIGNKISMKETFLGSSLPIFTFNDCPKKTFKEIVYEQTFENCAKMYYCEIFTDKSRYELNKKHVFKNMKGLIKLNYF